MRRLLQRFARSLIEIDALRESPAFRRMFCAQLMSSIGAQITLVALMFHVYQITESTLKVGMLGAVMVVPTLVVSLLGGTIADAMDRRHLLIIVQSANVLVSGSLAIITFYTHPPLWSLYILAALASSLAAIDGPARTATIPMLVKKIHLRSAIQLREVLTQSGRTFGPIIGGLIIGKWGVATAYAVDAVGICIAVILFHGLPSLMPEAKRKFELSAITEAMHFVAKRPVLACTFWADIIAMVFGQQRALFPAYAISIYAVGANGVGLMYAAPSAGALIGVMFMGVFRKVKREGLAVIVSVAIWGLCIALFAISPSFEIALFFLAVAGAADMVSAVFRQTIFLSIVPDELRGRLSAVHIMVVTGGPPLGDTLNGSMGEFLGVRTSSLIGGAACIVGSLALAARVPDFIRFVDNSTHPAN